MHWVNLKLQEIENVRKRDAMYFAQKADVELRFDGFTVREKDTGVWTLAMYHHWYYGNITDIVANTSNVFDAAFQDYLKLLGFNVDGDDWDTTDVNAFVAALIGKHFQCTLVKRDTRHMQHRCSEGGIYWDVKRESLICVAALETRQQYLRENPDEGDDFLRPVAHLPNSIRSIVK